MRKVSIALLETAVFPAAVAVRPWPMREFARLNSSHSTLVVMIHRLSVLELEGVQEPFFDEIIIK